MGGEAFIRYLRCLLPKTKGITNYFKGGPINIDDNPNFFLSCKVQLLTKQKLQVLVTNPHNSCSCLQCKGVALEISQLLT